MLALKRNENIDRLEKALVEARKEYNRLIEMEKNADPAYVDYYVYRIKAQSKMLESLKSELMLEMEKVG